MHRAEPPAIEHSKDADLRGSWPALQRAAQRAREIAAQTGTTIVISHNGVIKHIDPRYDEDTVEEFIREDVNWGLHGTD